MNKSVIVSATRYFDVKKENVDLPLGLGSCQIAAASISRETDFVASCYFRIFHRKNHHEWNCVSPKKEKKFSQ